MLSTEQEVIPARNAIDAHAHYSAVKEELVDIFHSGSVPDV